MIAVILLTLGLIWILFATIEDLRIREVANWLNFSLIIFALGIRFFYSLFEAGGFDMFYQGLFGLGVFFIIGNLFYYGRFFAGGDAKLMIALGTILPIGYSYYYNLNIFFWFFVLFLFSGAVYGILFSIYLTLLHFKNFKKEFVKTTLKNKYPLFGVMSFGILIMIFGLFQTSLFYLGIFVFLFPYLFLYAKVVDKVCMIKKINTKHLREGDWLLDDVNCGGKKIKANWNGVTNKEIDIIHSFKKSVFIKQGIPFVPVFLISYVILIILYLKGYLLSFSF